MEWKYQLLTAFTLLGLLMISIFGSCKPKLFKFSFNSVTIRDSQFRFQVSKNIKTTLTFSPSKHNLIIKLIPETGLGNRLFMYASALGIALENKRTLGLYPFIPEMEASLSISSPWVSDFKEDQYTELRYEKCCCYYPESQHLENESLSLSGYLQSWKYFHKYRDIILSEFRFNQFIREHTNTFLSQIKSGKTNTTLIGIHIRRGDFLIQAKVDLGYTVATEDYLRKAVQYFQNKFNCLFVIATNDRVWAESLFSKIVNIQYVFTGTSSPYNLVPRAIPLIEKRCALDEGDSPYIDMSVISSCDHVITTTGTFSWWIGYLSKGTVLYYKTFPKEGSWLETTEFCDMENYFFPHWIGLS